MPTGKIMHSSPEDTEQAFYEAIEAGDVNALMDLWADDEQIVCVHPGGPRLIGYAAIRESWREILTGTQLHIRPAEVTAINGLMVAVHNVVEQLLLLTTDRQVVHVVATNVYMKGPTGWKIVAHHASPAIEQTAEADDGAADLDDDDIPTLH
ncbi:MAG: YybH family protein [Burkholderiaceae bacterium]|jgi:ketosteroid isomerase-like protein